MGSSASNVKTATSKNRAQWPDWFVPIALLDLEAVRKSFEQLSEQQRAEHALFRTNSFLENALHAALYCWRDSKLFLALANGNQKEAQRLQPSTESLLREKTISMVEFLLSPPNNFFKLQVHSQCERDSQSFSALHRALLIPDSECCITVVRLLLQHCEPSELRRVVNDQIGELGGLQAWHTPLILAALHNSSARNFNSHPDAAATIIRELVESGASPKVEPGDVTLRTTTLQGLTALHAAAKRADIGALSELLLTCKMPSDLRQITPQWAIEFKKSRPQPAQRHLHPSYEGRTALVDACQYTADFKRALLAVRLLIEHGADVDATTVMRTETPLYIALQSRNVDLVVELVLRHKCLVQLPPSMEENKTSNAVIGGALYSSVYALARSCFNENVRKGKRDLSSPNTPVEGLLFAVCKYFDSAAETQQAPFAGAKASVALMPRSILGC
uniref:Uncharacterized protein n=1 Tax=Chromera velia CCMP2878 TaxID=1169474 RepID=A0A0G4HWV9_9ALVE|eukprot:Cvel_1464.t1-p1 / transcript=Cvel_1464.t1 / gene=Cvel_1464 / organism=Chromera_velia_CCMP2878 / gene_product=hypothetical protein / transcript_product=hypothetical protein / location=Cvel_scaffold51:99818-101155(-) / protein_length=446 / sequence_SO=supercontig / SO=protein_coding / is_pseudo=false